MYVTQPKKDALKKEMKRLHIFEEDMIEKFILGSGKGGQKINTNCSCVYLKHLPTGIEVKCQKDRKRELNRFFARRLLCEKIAKQIYLETTQTEKRLRKIAQQKKRRSRRFKENMLEMKRKHSAMKTLRKKINPD